MTAEILRIRQISPTTLRIKLNRNFCEFANAGFLKNSIRYSPPPPKIFYSITAQARNNYLTQTKNFPMIRSEFELPMNPVDYLYFNLFMNLEFRKKIDPGIQSFRVIFLTENLKTGATYILTHCRWLGGLDGGGKEEFLVRAFKRLKEVNNCYIEVFCSFDAGELDCKIFLNRLLQAF